MAESELRIADADGNHLPTGETGEILTRGATVSVGMYGDPAATAAAFNASGWARTGDLGYLDETARLRVVGRLKEVIIRGGRNVPATEIEEVARQHPLILDAAAVSYPDPELGERCALVIVQTEGPDVTLEDVTRFFEGRGFPKWKWPERLAHVPELPMTGQGKVRKNELQRMLSGN
jgi:cyclohexanecarboxylate-CoA ligase